VRETSLAEAKAHLSELVDEAEHKGKRIVILRHGKPAAAIVPVRVAAPERRARKPMNAEQARQSVEAFVAEFTGVDPGSSAVADLIARRR